MIPLNARSAEVLEEITRPTEAQKYELSLRHPQEPMSYRDFALRFFEENKDKYRLVFRNNQFVILQGGEWRYIDFYGMAHNFYQWAHDADLPYTVGPRSKSQIGDVWVIRKIFTQTRAFFYQHRYLVDSETMQPFGAPVKEAV